MGCSWEPSPALITDWRRVEPPGGGSRAGMTHHQCVHAHGLEGLNSVIRGTPPC